MTIMVRWSAAAALSTVLCAAAARADFVDATGRLVFTDDHDGKVKGLANVRVRLMDENWGSPDQEVGTTFTDVDGNYRVKGAAGDPYIQFVMQRDHYVDVRDALNYSYRFNTPTRHDAQGAVSFATVTIDSEVAHLWAYTARLYDFFKKQTGQLVPGSDGNVGVVYPTIWEFGAPWTTNVAIHWIADYDFYRALFHEFGHRVREGADGDGTEFLNDAVSYTYARSHSFDLLSNDGFAFNEGWAEYYSTFFDDKTWDASSNIFDYLTNWTQIANGHMVEGNVAQRLLDLSVNCGGLAKMFRALASAQSNSSWAANNRKNGIHSFDELAFIFKKQNPGCKNKINDWFCNGGPSGQCVTKEKGPNLGPQFLSSQTDRCGRKQVVITSGTPAVGSATLGVHQKAEFKVKSPVITWRCVEGKSSSNEQTVCTKGTTYIKVERGDLNDRLLKIRCYH